MAHTVVKPEDLAGVAARLVEGELIVPNAFTKMGVEAYKGKANDTLNVPVQGVLPHRTYGWRNDRSNPITLDEYTERSISVSFGGNFYSGSPVTDEQRDFDTTAHSGPVEVRALEAQARAVGRGLESRSTAYLTGADYEVEISVAAQSGSGQSVKLQQALVEARRVLDRFHAPKEGRVLVVGSDFDTELQLAENFNLASNVGDQAARSALREAVIGRWKEFTILTSTAIPADEAYAFTSGAFVFLNASPSVPQGVSFGATGSYNDVSVRVIKDYDPMYMQNRLVTNTWAGFQTVKDPLVYTNKATHNEVVSDSEYLLRAVKLGLDIAEVYPEAESGNESDVFLATGVGRDSSA